MQLGFHSSTIRHKDWIFIIASDVYHLDLAIRYKDGIFIIVYGYYVNIIHD